MTHIPRDHLTIEVTARDPTFWALSVPKGNTLTSFFRLLCCFLFLSEILPVVAHFFQVHGYHPGTFQFTSLSTWNLRTPSIIYGLLAISFFWLVPWGIFWPGWLSKPFRHGGIKVFKILLQALIVADQKHVLSELQRCLDQLCYRLPVGIRFSAQLCWLGAYTSFVENLSGCVSVFFSRVAWFEQVSLTVSSTKQGLCPTRVAWWGIVFSPNFLIASNQIWVECSIFLARHLLVVVQEAHCECVCDLRSLIKNFSQSCYSHSPTVHDLFVVPCLDFCSYDYLTTIPSSWSAYG